MFYSSGGCTRGVWLAYLLCMSKIYLEKKQFKRSKSVNVRTETCWRAPRTGTRRPRHSRQPSLTGSKERQWASPQQREKPARAESITAAAPDTHPAPGRAARKLPVQVRCSGPAPSATCTDHTAQQTPLPLTATPTPNFLQGPTLRAQGRLVGGRETPVKCKTDRAAVASLLGDVVRTPHELRERNLRPVCWQGHDGGVDPET